MHCGHKNDADILSDLKSDRIPDEVLANKCCWSRISQVRYVTHRYSLDRPSVPPRALGREPTLVARQLVLQRPAAGSFHVERASQ